MKLRQCWGANFCSPFPVFFIIFFLCLLPLPAHSQSEYDADLNIRVDAGGNAAITVFLDKAPGDGALVRRSIERAIGGTLQEVQTTTDEDGGMLRASSKDAFQRHGLLVEGRVDPGPLVEAWSSLHPKWLTLTLSHPKAKYIGPSPGTRTDHPRRVSYFLNIALPTRRSPPVLTISYGYRPMDLLKLWTPLLLVLLFPLAVVGWLRRMALHGSHLDPTVIWFSYVRWAQYTSLVMWLTWTGLILLLDLWEFWRFLFNNHTAQGGMLTFTLCSFAPPALIQVLCTALAHPIFARVRESEWTLGDLVWQSIWSQVAFVLPLVCFGAGIGALIDRQPQYAILWVGGALLIRHFSRQQLVRVTQTVLHALTGGELRDRIFALAASAGVEVRQVYYLPAGKSRTANAFAMIGNRVLVTDYLLQHLSKREIDAIMAHELAHLKHRHPAQMSRLVLLVVVIPIVALNAANILHWANVGNWIAVQPLFVLLGLGIFYFMSRRFERTADAGAIRLTGDPEALITGLAKTTRLNMMPMEWGKWQERTLTHPSTMRRAQEVARLGGVSPERLSEILKDLDSDPERYSLPFSLSEKAPIFSTTFKSRVILRILWTQRAAIILIPTLFALLARIPGNGGVPELITWALYLLGGVTTIGVSLLLQSKMSVHCYRELERRLSERLREEGHDPYAGGGVFVNFSPDDSPRIYEGFANWDIGFLFVGTKMTASPPSLATGPCASDYLCYMGEQAQFSLHREQIADIRVGSGRLGWLKAPAIYISWGSKTDGSRNTFYLRPGNVGSLFQLTSAVEALAGRLQLWQQREEDNLAILSLSEMEPPHSGTVTGALPQVGGQFSLLIQNLVQLGGLAAGVSVLIGLPLSLANGGGGVYVICMALFMAVFHWLPYRLGARR